MSIIDGNHFHQCARCGDQVLGVTSYLDDIDNLDRLTTQAKSLVTAMVANDNLEGLKFETISNLLWLLGDRISDIETVQASLIRRFRE